MTREEADSIEQDIERIADDIQFAITYATDKKTAQAISQILGILNGFLAHTGGEFEEIQDRVQQLRDRLTRLYEFTIDADAMRMVGAILDKLGDIYIQQDPETGDVATSAWDADGKKIHRTEGETIHEALSNHLMFQAQKACKACGLVKRLSEYSKNRNNSDGHTQRCKDCERRRVQAYDKARRTEKRLEDTEAKKCHRCGKYRRLKFFWKDGIDRRNTCVDCMKIKRKEKNESDKG